jgi:hypothetical protein
MKSRRRHELQENVLAAEIGKVAEFLRTKRGSHVATGVLVAALVLFGCVIISRFMSTRSSARHEDLQRRWDLALSGQLKPDERISTLIDLADQDDNERIAALAGVELGYHYALQSLASRQASERAALAEKAGQWYLQTIEKFPKQQLAVAKAHYGIGKLRESVRQFKTAAESYRKAKSFADLAGQPVTRLAEAALQGLKALEAPVRMASTAPATQPASAPATQPASRPATAPAMQPASRPATVPATRPAEKRAVP